MTNDLSYDLPGSYFRPDLMETSSSGSSGRYTGGRCSSVFDFDTLLLLAALAASVVFLQLAITRNMDTDTEMRRFSQENKIEDVQAGK